MPVFRVLKVSKELWAPALKVLRAFKAYRARKELPDSLDPTALRAHRALKDPLVLMAHRALKESRAFKVLLARERKAHKERKALLELVALKVLRVLLVPERPSLRRTTLRRLLSIQ
jgi:hypothetical protein